MYAHEKFADVKREIVVMSLLLAVGSVATSYYFWTVDWWRPETITGTRVGVEDFLLGFAMGGVMTGVYHLVFKNHDSKSVEKFDKLRFIAPVLLIFVSVYMMMNFGLTSFWSVTITMVVSTVFLYFERRDLIIKSLSSGVFTLLVSTLFYIIIYWIDVSWADSTYMFSGLSGIRIATFPVEEFIFWFIAGCFFGVYYEYVMKSKIVKSSKK
jgi:hypothetical protein